tara:strand:- start:229 stop:399 length:171 start_codon:yes stop_codon:yes gene_type:complete
MKIFIQYQQQFGNWVHYQEKHNERDAYRTAARRAQSTKKRHRLVDKDGTLLDLIEP